VTYSFVPSNLRVVLDITFGVLPPYDWMVMLRFEEVSNVFGPSLNGIELLLAEYSDKVSLNGGDSGRSKVVSEDPEC
jgi:hypothetical protein